MTENTPGGADKLTRRQVLDLFGKGAGAVAAKSMRIAPLAALNMLYGSERGDYGRIWDQDIPDQPGTPDIEKIRRSFRREGTFGEIGKEYVQEYVNLIQEARILLEGETIQSLMAKTIEPDGVNTRLRVSARDNMDRARINGRMFHSRESGTPSEAFIAKQLSLTEAFYTLDHELVHAITGEGEVVAYGYSLVTQLLMTLKHPDLFLKDADAKNSPLLHYLNRLTRDVARSEETHPNEVNNLMATLEFLDRYLEEPRVAGLTGLSLAVDFRNTLVVLDADADRRHQKLYMEGRKLNAAAHLAKVQQSLRAFVDKVTSPYGVSVPFKN